MTPLWNRTRLTQRLGIEYPIVQGPLGGLSSQRLTAAVSNSADSAHSAFTGALPDGRASLSGVCMLPTMHACIRKRMRPTKRRDRQGARLVSMKMQQHS
jgi:NAD(P)H-dependent flavin oxidoreductase YrpB (nitropropane dioxygenase family)